MSEVSMESPANGSPMMRFLTACVLFVYTTVTVAPDVRAAEAAPSITSSQPSPGPEISNSAPSDVVENAIRNLEGLRVKRMRGLSVVAREDDRLILRELRRTLAESHREARAEFEAFESKLREWRVPEAILERHRSALLKLDEQAKASDVDLAGAIEASDSRVIDSRIEGLLERLREIRTRKPHQRFDASQMPYKPASNKARAPKTTREELANLFPSVTEDRVLLASVYPLLALQAGPGTVSPEYLSSNVDVQITPEIEELAAALGSNPVTIFNWVHNNIQYLPTYGSIQGSELTLQNGRGNAYDTASLLIALYRAAGIPARYAYGTVEVPIEQVMNWVGVTSADQAQDLIGQGGIPNVAVTSGGRIKSLRFEHVWVEAWVDFVPSRGAINKTGDSWVALDPSFKTYVVERGIDVSALVPFDGAATLAALNESTVADTQTGVISSVDLAQVAATFRQFEEQFAQAVDQVRPGATSLDLLDRRYIQASNAPVLPAGLPYKKVAAGNTYATLPSALRHSLRISLYSSALDQSEDLPSMSGTLSLPSIGLRRVSVNYRPASAADEALIQSAIDSGATSLPAYLIRVVPQLKLDDDVVAEGPAVTMGSAQYWQARLSGPIPASNASVPFQHTVAGDLLVFSVDGAGIDGSAASMRYGYSSLPNAAEDLHFAGLSYWTAHNWTDRFTAEGLNGRIVRLPSLALLSAGFTPRYFFGIARQGSYHGRVLDARRVTIAAVAPSNEVRRAIVQLAGIQGSQWEATALNSVFGRQAGTAMSATEYMTYAATHGVPIQVIVPDNAATAIANLQVSQDVAADIAAAVQAGHIAMIPQRDLNVRGRVGNGYMILDPDTGAGAYLIDGGINGGFEAPCGGPFAQPPVASIGGGGGAQLMAQALPVPAATEIATTIPRIVQSEAALVRVAEIGAQAANSPYFAQARSLAPRLSPQIAFRFVAGGFALAIGAAVLTSVIVAVAYSIAVLFTYRLARIELELLAAQEGADEEVHPVPEPLPEPNPDEDECKCQKNPQLPECGCQVRRIPHKGGHAIHNACARLYNSAAWEGQDTCWLSPRLGFERCFDAGSFDGKTVYEVKVNRYSTYNDYVKRKTRESNARQALMQSMIAKDCGLTLQWITKSTEHANDLNADPAFIAKPVIPNEACGDAPDEQLPPEDVPPLVP